MVTGNLRCGELAWQSLYDNFLDYTKADLAVLTQPVNTSIYPNPSILHRARYVWSVPYYDDWADAVDLMNVSGWRDIVPQSVKYPHSNFMLGGIGKFKGSMAILGMYKWWLANLIEKHKLHERYSQFVITRNDHYYYCPYDVSKVNPSLIWVPKGENYGGITDRFYVTGAQNVLASLDIFYPIINDTERFSWLYERNGPPPAGTNSEYVLKTRWRENGLYTKRMHRVMFTCASDSDTSRWGKPREMVPEGVRLKYKGEYAMSKWHCSKYNITQS